MSKFRTPAFIISATLAAHAIGCGKAAFLNEISAGSQAASGYRLVNVAGLRGAAAQADSASAADCELELRIITWDSLVHSDYVCIKHKDRPIGIPQRIALTTEPNVVAKTDIYCDAAYGKEENGVVQPCVWNRQFYDRYPIDFMIRAVDEVPLAKITSLVRVLRNGRAVFSWNARSESSKVSELRIPGRNIGSPEYFKEAVDLDLYLLASGADEAKAAAAITAAAPVNNWKATLATAFSAAATASTPPAMQQAMACVQAKFQYFAAIARELDTTATKADRDKFHKEAEDLEKKIGTLHDEAAHRSKAKPLSIAVATDDPIGTGNAQPKLADVELKEGNIVAFFARDGKTVSLKKYNSKKPWADATISDIPTESVVSEAQEALFQIAAGGRKGQVFSVPRAANATSTDALHDIPVTAVSLGLPCETISNELKQAHVEYFDTLSSLVSDGPLRKVGVTSKTVAALSGQLSLAVTQLRDYVTASIEKLPAGVKEGVTNDFAWLRFVDQSFATVLSTAQMLAANGADIEQSVKSAIHDPQAQLRAYEAFAAALPTDQTLFSSPIQDPAAGPGEARFSMTFRRPRQIYYLLAWNAIPIPVTSTSQVKVELRLENLIPIIDVVGWHWQTGWSLVPVGGLGLGLLGTRETVAPPGKDAYTSDFVVGPQLNVSASGFRIGVSYLLHNAEGCSKDCFVDGRNVRVLIGADLVSLFTGKDTAVVRSTGVDLTPSSD